MEGFKKLSKQIACFKEGGSVQKEVHNFTKRDRKNVEPGDLAQDKKLIKKAFKQHDEAEHDKEPTEIKLKKGGRAKKEVGTVKKFCGGGNAYKEGGSVTNVYEAKKKSGDISNIEKVKDIKPGKAAAPSKAAVKPAFAGSDVEKEKSKPAGHKDPYIKSKQSGKTAAAPSGAKGPDAFKRGGKVKKYSGEFGSHVTSTEQAHAKDRYREKMRLDPTQQRQLEAQQATASAKAALGSQFSNAEAQQAAAAMANANQLPRPVPMPSAPQGPQTAPMPQPSVAPQGALSGLTPMKKGGKAKKDCK
jgi:hypothetical protein